MLFAINWVFLQFLSTSKIGDIMAHFGIKNQGLTRSAGINPIMPLVYFGEENLFHTVGKRWKSLGTGE